MNPTEKGRRSDALYYDDLGRRSLCDMIAHLESELADARKREEFWTRRAQELEMESITRKADKNDD